MTLDLLTVAVARELLARHLGVERVAGQSAAVDALIAICARLPLALAVVGARASEHPDFPLELLVAQLRDTRGKLDALNGWDLATDVRAVFSWSYRYLSAGAAQMFRLLGVHPGPDISLPAAASLVGFPHWQAREAMDELTHARMVTEHTPGRFAFHDLLRAYAIDHAHTVDCDAERCAAVHRVLDHYLHTAYSSALLLHPTRDRLTLAPPQLGVIPEDFADDRQALVWFEAEHAVMLAAIAQAANTRFDVHAWQLPWTLATFFDRQGHWHDWASTQHTALAAAQRLGNDDGQARAERLLGRAYIRLGLSNEAQTHLRQAIDLYQQLGNRIGQAHVRYDLASVFGRQGRNDGALDQVQQAHGLYQAAGHQVGQARALNAIGWYYAMLGNHYQARICCEQALPLCRELGDRLGEAGTLDSLGYAHQHLGNHAHAIACYQQAIDLWRELGNRYHQAITLIHLGDTHHAKGDCAATGDTWQQALAILDSLQHPDADQIRAKIHQLDTT